MARLSIDHQARKNAIVAKAIRLFAQEGYKDVTFQSLASRCGVARTVLYRYFRDKRQIFASAVSALVGRVAAKHSEIVRSETTAAMRLSRICAAVTATLFDNREFMCVVIDFVLTQKRAGYDMTRRVMRFTLGLKRTLHTLIVWGVHRGEFAADTDADVVTETLYAIFESAVLRLTITDDAVQTEVLDRIDYVLKGLRK